jgi:hypothetical protein
VTRSIWHQEVGDCKTEASAKPVPMDSYMAEDLLRWRRQSPYPMDDDYVFASPTMKGKQPYWPDNLMKRYIKPVAQGERHQQEHRLAHFPPLLRHAAEGQRGRCQDRSGALTAREQQDHAGCLHAGSELEQASRTEQGCKDDGSRSWVRNEGKIPAKVQ